MKFKGARGAYAVGRPFQKKVTGLGALRKT